MQLLDATLAFALTLAALATVVTVIMEIGLRITRRRKKNLIRVMKLLDQELGNGKLGISAAERWAFFTQVVSNPAEAAPKPSGYTQQKNLEELFSSYGRDKKWRGLFDRTSLEYLLRRLAESEGVRTALREASAEVSVEFNRLARRYEEFEAAVSASFKRYAQFWSIAIGMALAIGANIDGVRIFEAYRTDPGLAAAVIENQDSFFESYRTAEESLKQLDTTPEDENELESIRIKARQARQQLVDLAAMGMPWGWKFYPNCPFGQGREAWVASSLQCQSLAPAVPQETEEEAVCSGLGRILKTARHDPAGFLVWLVRVALTGILTGLGAPFWFDVARRLAQIRQGLQQPTASSEYRLSGQEANGDPEKRRQIVASVLADAVAEVSASPAFKTASLLGPKALRL